MTDVSVKSPNSYENGDFSCLIENSYEFSELSSNLLNFYQIYVIFNILNFMEVTTMFKATNREQRRHPNLVNEPVPSAYREPKVQGTKKPHRKRKRKLC